MWTRRESVVIVRRGPSPALLLLAGLLAPIACDSVTDPETGSEVPDIVDSALREVAPLVRVLEVELAEPAPVQVHYGTAGEPELVTSSPAARVHRIPLARLRADRTYRYRVAGTGVEDTFETAPLPGDLASFDFHASGTPTTPLALLHLISPGSFQGYVIVDGGGEVVWYLRTEGIPYGATRRENGNFVFMDGGRGLLEVTPELEVVHELPQDTVARELHHDVIATPDNTLLFLAFDTREFDGVPLKGEAIWEWSPEAGTAERRWSSWDHLSPAQDRGPRFGTEWMHANSLSLGPRGNVLVSVHYFNQVLSVAAGWEELEWRLGGVNATITVPDEDRFSGQHTAAELTEGRVLLFDNRTEEGGDSRAVEFELDGDEARRIWEWSPSRPNFTAAVSSVRRLSTGNLLVAFGMSAGVLGSSGPIEVYEITAAGQPVWHLEVDGPFVMYRAEPVSSVAGEA